MQYQDYHVIIPMSGEGSRFKNKGYRDIKPLISVMGFPMIDWVCRLYPEEIKMTFIVREEHVDDTDVLHVLKKIKPNSQIQVVKGAKKGPMWAVHQIREKIALDEKVIINYCDFFMHWSFHEFDAFVKSNNCDGAIPCYSKFHPHYLRPNKYATVLLSGDRMVRIEEKKRWHENFENESTSAGNYYFKSGKLLLEYLDRQIDDGNMLNGEYYTSLTYKAMLEDGLDVRVFNGIKKFCQWGTPEDLEDFNYWEQIFRL